MKNVQMGRGARLQFRAEFYNLFNNVNYGNPNTTFAAANFGRITSAGSMRQMQLGAKGALLSGDALAARSRDRGDDGRDGRRRDDRANVARRARAPSASGGPHLLEGRRADPPEELPGLPSSW